MWTVLYIIALHCTEINFTDKLSTELTWTPLKCTALICTELHFTKLHWNALNCTVMHWASLQCTTMHSLKFTSLHCTTLNSITLHITVLSYHCMLYNVQFLLPCQETLTRVNFLPKNSFSIINPSRQLIAETSSPILEKKPCFSVILVPTRQRNVAYYWSIVIHPGEGMLILSKNNENYLKVFALLQESFQTLCI